MDKTMFTKKEFHLIPKELFLDLSYPKEAPGWIENKYFPRTASRTKGNSHVSYTQDLNIPDSNSNLRQNFTVISSKSWREIESSGYGVYTYEDTSVLSLSIENGIYQVTVTLGNPSNQNYSCYIRANQIIKIDSILITPNNLKSVSFFVPVYQNQLELAFLFGNYASLDSASVIGDVYLSSLIIEKNIIKKSNSDTAKSKPTIFLASDSTVQTYESVYYPQTGWGQVLCEFFTEKKQIMESDCNSCPYPQSRIYETEFVRIENRSIGGRSSRSFLEEGKLDSIILDLRPNDFLFIQWGHNDATAIRPNRYVNASDFQTYLLPYYQACQLTGAQLVLVTPAARRNCDEQGTFQISFPEYRQQMIAFSKKYKIPLLDLGKYSTEFLNTLTPEESKSVFMWLSPNQYPDGAYPDGLSDNTHLQRYGAMVFADIIAFLICHYTEDTTLDPLKPLVRPIEISAIPKPPRFTGNTKSIDPTMVTGFAVQEITKDESMGNFLLSFQEVENAVAYQIYQKEKNDITYHKIKKISCEEKKNAVTLPFSAKCGTIYQYYVTAVFSNGTEGRSSRILEIDLS